MPDLRPMVTVWAVALSALDTVKISVSPFLIWEATSTTGAFKVPLGATTVTLRVALALTHTPLSRPSSRRVRVAVLS